MTALGTMRPRGAAETGAGGRPAALVSCGFDGRFIQVKFENEGRPEVLALQPAPGGAAHQGSGRLSSNENFFQTHLHKSSDGGQKNFTARASCVLFPMQAVGGCGRDRIGSAPEGRRRSPERRAHSDYKTTPPGLSLQIFAKRVAERGRVNVLTV
jgi:hypothetical protein